MKWPVNSEAPFNFSFEGNVVFYEREKYTKETLLELAHEISPDLIYCSGWIDKDYLKVCKKYRRSIPVIVGFDNQWTGSSKQWLAVASKSFVISPYFSHAWVPGDKQVEYAKKLGFPEDKILKGFYAADFDFFHNLYLKNSASKKAHFPKRFIYVGRYVEHKGIKDLWQAFVELQQEQPNSWELWCVGVGPLAEQVVQHPKIKHFGFVQPEEMQKLIAETGVFVLPSHFEPWGVVVHEFAAAGFPLICSDKVGANSAFLQDTINGYIFNSGDVMMLKNSLRKMMNKSDDELYAMGEHSVDKAREITPGGWAEMIMSVVG